MDLTSNLEWIWSWFRRAIDFVLVSALTLEAVVVFVNIITRSYFRLPLIWADELSTLLLAILAFIGGAMAYWRGQHVAVMAVVNRLPESWRPAQEAFVEWMIVGVGIAGVALPTPLLQQALAVPSPTLQIADFWFDLPLSAGSALLVIFGLAKLWALPRKLALTIGLIAAAAIALAMSTSDIWVPLVSDQVLLYGLVLFAFLLVAGVPIGFALGITALVLLFMWQTTPLVAIPANMIAGVRQPVLLSVPLFILAGLVMATGGISSRLVLLVASLVGHFRGGLHQAIVLLMYLVSGISGSKGADMAAVGTVMAGMLRKEGYDSGKTVAVLASSAAMGETIPPSIAMLVLGSITTLSVGALFAAGLLPAALIAAAIMVMIYIQARKDTQLRQPAASWVERLAASRQALLALAMPVILFGGILSGIATPTEISAVAVVYGVLLAVAVYRTAPASLVGTVRDSTMMIGMVLFIVSTATAFSWVLTQQGIGNDIATAMLGVPGGRTAFMLISIVVLVIMGSALEGLPALLIFGPLLLPVATSLGINPLHYGVVLIVAMGIGAFCPPLGVGFYVACAVGGSSVERATRPMLPLLAVLLIGLILIAFLPAVTLIVPQVLHFAQAR